MPLPTDPKWKPGPFTELRVHGVGNTPLERILDDPYPVRVAGDDTAGFYRRAGDQPSTRRGGPVDSDGGLRSRGDLEAYDWGGFNIGGGWKALWVLLLPFTLVNLAGWMVRNGSRWGRKSVEVFGLGVTIAFVTWVGAVLIDLLALQCGYQKVCVEKQFWLKPLDWWGQTPDDRIAMVLLLPVAGIFGLLWVSRRRHRDYERVAATVLGEFPTRDQVDEKYLRDLRRDGPGATPAPPRLNDRDLWHHDDPAAAHYHGAAALGALAFGASWALWRTTGYQPDLILWIAGLLIIAVSVLGLVIRRAPWTLVRTPPPLANWSQVVLTAATVAMALVVLFGLTAQRGLEPGRVALTSPSVGPHKEVVEVVEQAARLRSSLIASNLLLLTIFLVGATVSLLLHMWWARRPKRRRALKGWGAVASCAAALAVVGMFGVALASPLAAFLGDRPVEVIEAAGLNRGECERILDQATCRSVATQTATRLDLKVRTADLEAALRVEAPAGDRPSAAGLTTLAMLAAVSAETDTRASRLGPPIIDPGIGVDLLALAVAALALVMAAWAILIELRVRYLIRSDKLQEVAEKMVPLRPTETQHWAEAMARELRASPRNTRRIRLLLVPMVLVPVAVALMFADLDPEAGIATGIYDWITTHASWATTFAVFVSTALALVLGVVIRRAYKPNAEKSFGGIWDVITFWPRRFHPFGVPSYGVRAVPELARRLETLTHGSGQRVLLSAHSGGVLISISALMLVSPATRQKVALLTYGSPTGALQGEVFPEYADVDELLLVAQHLRVTSADPVRWRNLWRLTDWTGGYALGPRSDRVINVTNPRAAEDPRSEAADIIRTVEVLQIDPSLTGLAIGDLLPYPIGHTDYLHDPKYDGAEDPRYRAARKELVEMLYP